jgi:hypothetical protein
LPRHPISGGMWSSTPINVGTRSLYCDSFPSRDEVWIAARGCKKNVQSFRIILGLI